MTNAIRRKPSWANGFARNAAQSAYPELWRDIMGAWVPALGPTGAKLIDLSPYKNDGVFESALTLSDWVISKKDRISPGYVLDFNNNADAKVTIPASEDQLKIIQDITILARYEKTSTGVFHTLIANEEISGDVSSERYGFFVNNTESLSFRVQDTAFNSSLACPQNIPVTLVATRRGTTASSVNLWVDHARATGAANGDMTNNGATYIGDTSNDRDNMLGFLSGVLLWNRALSLHWIDDLLIEDPFAMFRLRQRYWAPVLSVGRVAGLVGPRGLVGVGGGLVA